MLTSSWPLMTSALTRSTLTKSTGQTGSTSRWGPHVSDTGSMTSGPRVSGLGKRKRKRLTGATGLKEVRAGLGWTIGSACDGAGRLGSSGWTAQRIGLACWIGSRSRAGLDGRLGLVRNGSAGRLTWLSRLLLFASFSFSWSGGLGRRRPNFFFTSFFSFSPPSFPG